MPGLTTEQFLAACIRHAKTRVEVDFAALAEETGMSLGGARNKVYATMKQIEEERATAAAGGAPVDAPPATPSKKRGSKAAAANGETPAKKPRKKAADKVKAEELAEEDEGKVVGVGEDPESTTPAEEKVAANGE